MEGNEALLALDAEAAWVARREAAEAAALVAVFVGVPAAVAACAVIALFALTLVVLVAPLVAAVLTAVAWHGSRPPDPSADGAVARR